MADHSGFRWGTAVLHAVLALVATVAVSATMAVLFDVADPRRFGEGVGRFSLFMMLGAFGVSWLFQTGRRVAAMIVGGLLGTLLAVLVVVTVMAVADRQRRADAVDGDLGGGPEGGAAPGPSQPLPAVDLVRADGMLRHPTLGFSIPDPGPSFSSQPELAAARMPSGPDSRGWIYADMTTGETVTIILGAGMGSTSKTFEEFFAGVLFGMEEKAAISEKRERWVRWEERRAHAQLVVSGTTHMRVDAFALPGGEGLLMISTSPRAEQFDSLAAGVKMDAR